MGQIFKASNAPVHEVCDLPLAEDIGISFDACRKGPRYAFVGVDVGEKPPSCVYLLMFVSARESARTEYVLCKHLIRPESGLQFLRSNVRDAIRCHPGESLVPIGYAR